MDQLEGHLLAEMDTWTVAQQERVRVAGVLVPLLLFADDIVECSTCPKAT